MFWKSALKPPFHLDMARVSYPQLHLSRLCLTRHRRDTAKQYREARGREIKVYFLIAITSKYILKLLFLAYQPAGDRIPISEQAGWLTGILLSTRDYGGKPSGLAKTLLPNCKEKLGKTWLVAAVTLYFTEKCEKIPWMNPWRPDRSGKSFHLILEAGFLLCVLSEITCASWVPWGDVVWCVSHTRLSEDTVAWLTGGFFLSVDFLQWAENLWEGLGRSQQLSGSFPMAWTHCF